MEIKMKSHKKRDKDTPNQRQKWKGTSKIDEHKKRKSIRTRQIKGKYGKEQQNTYEYKVTKTLKTGASCQAVFRRRT